MDRELINALSELLDKKLEPIKEEIGSIKKDNGSIKKEITSVKEEIKLMRTQQEEDSKILRALEHKFEINKSEHDKMSNDIAKLTGAVEAMRKDLNVVEVVTARNMENIAQLKVIK